MKTEENKLVFGRRLEPDNNSEESDNNSNGSDYNTMYVTLGAGGGGCVLILSLTVFAVLRCNKKKEDRSGNRESIDLNQQYGADEYYEYMKHDTNVVDDNDMYNYNDCDYEDLILLI